MKYSIIVVTHNREALLKDCLDSIHVSLKYLPSYEIFVVNNASTDKTPQLLEEYAKKIPNFIVINLEKNYGAIARNKALERATGEYIVQVDDDAKVRANWMYVVMPHFTEGIGAVGPLGMYFRDWHEFFKVSNFPVGTLVDGLVGYFWVFKNEGWRYDEAFQTYMEEQDMQMQMRLKGYKFKVCSADAAIHLCAGTKDMNLEVINSNRMIERWSPKTKELHFEYVNQNI